MADGMASGSSIDGSLIDNSRFDPELRDALPHLSRADLQDLGRTRQEEADRGRASLPTAINARLSIGDQLVAGLKKGSAAVGVRVFMPHHQSLPAPAVVWIHGGGFVRGGINSDHAHAACLAVAIDHPVIAVDYRLAPEHPYPAALDDCDAVLRWVRRPRGPFLSDRLAVVGISAGGGLAAALAIRARDRGEESWNLQALLMPMLDDRLKTSSMREFNDPRVFSRDKAAFCWRHYLSGIGPKVELVPQEAAPARAVNFAQLPRTYVSVAELDPLRDEGTSYAERLSNASTPVELHQFDGTFHGCQFSVPNARTSRRMRDELYDVLSRSLASG